MTAAIRRSARVGSRQFYLRRRPDMARWPDESKANVIAIALVFALFPLLCWLCWWWIKSP